MKKTTEQKLHVIFWSQTDYQGNMDKSIKFSEVQLLYLNSGNNYICPANFGVLLLESNMREKALKSITVKYYEII